jgi:Flp pilus assembly protein TadB
LRGPVEAWLTVMAGLLLCALTILIAVFPRVLVYPAMVLAGWGGVALLYKGYRLHRERKREEPG